MPDSYATSMEEIKGILEALIYVSEEPVKQEELLEVFPEESRESARRALEELLLEYGGGPRGLRIVRVAGGFRMQTRPEHDTWIRTLYRQRNRVRLSRAAVETLAIIAYRQPVTGPEIQSVRGANPIGVLQTLLERRLIRALGRKKVVGKPILYGTTEDFLIHFGLNSLADLPSLEDFPGMTSAGSPEEPPSERDTAIVEGIRSDGPEVRLESISDPAHDGEQDWARERLVNPPGENPQADGTLEDEEEE
jgi:segregation and condensation protein B